MYRQLIGSNKILQHRLSSLPTIPPPSFSASHTVLFPDTKHASQASPTVPSPVKCLHGLFPSFGSFLDVIFSVSCSLSLIMMCSLPIPCSLLFFLHSMYLRHSVYIHHILFIVILPSLKCKIHQGRDFCLCNTF